MQIVYISNRPAALRDTLLSISRFMPFVDDIVAVVPDAKKIQFDAITYSRPIKFLYDEALVQASLEGLDHQSRDYLLRTSLIEEQVIAQEFIMSDDDARPITHIDISFFKDRDKYHSYYFYDLKDWCFGATDFDIGQQNTYQVLKFLKYPHLSFASHMPQIIDKAILAESKQCFSRYADRLGLCEWSTYFNYARDRHPDAFHPPTTYRTLCWPDCASCWPKMFEPEEFVFENFTPRMYQRGGPFFSIDKDGEPEDARFEKILRWYKYELDVRRGDTLDNPTILRQVANTLLRPVRRLREVLWHDERARLMRLEQRIGRIEEIINKVSE